MGQRFQSVFILPDIFMNHKNPNNRNKKVLVFHNQWLYGHTALSLNLSILKRIKKGILKRDKNAYKTKIDYINHYLEKAVLNAVDYCSLEDLHNERKFHKPTEFIFKDFKHFGNELSREDNNNGFFICEITKNLKMKYAFISGFEDEENIKIKTPEKYLKLFYSNEEIIKANKGNKNYLKKILDGFLKFEKMNLKELSNTIKELNENKPSWAIK